MQILMLRNLRHLCEDLRMTDQHDLAGLNLHVKADIDVRSDPLTLVEQDTRSPLLVNLIK